jgi:hypothetical protein
MQLHALSSFMLADSTWGLMGHITQEDQTMWSNEHSFDSPWYEHMRLPVLASMRPSLSGASLWGQRSSNTDHLGAQQITHNSKLGGAHGGRRHGLWSNHGWHSTYKSIMA